MSSAEDELVRPAPEAADLPADPTDDPAGVRQSRGWPGLVAALPMALAAAVAPLTVVAALCLLGDAYRPALVLPIGLPLAAVAGGVVLWLAPARSARTLWPNLLALAGVVVMVWFNVRYGAQDIVVTRDPGTYTVTAQWLAHHSTARIPTQSTVFGDLVGGTSSSLGFGDTDAATVQSQYPNAAPMLVAMVGWVSDAWMLRFAPFIGGAALLAFYALARGVVREWWALGAMTLLAVSLPMMHFSRAVFSEPTTMLFLLGGMALLYACHERPSVPLHVVTGLAGGAAGLARIDGGIFLIAAAGYSVMALAQAQPGRRRKTGVEVAALLLSALIPYALGMRLTASLSSLYWYGPSGHRWEAYLPGIAAALVLLSGAVIVPLAWRGGSVRETAVRWAGRLSTAGAVLLIVLAVVGATRPLWYTFHQYIGPSYTNYVRYWQTLEHQPLDGTRSYAEYSLNWMSWYLSLVVVVTGVLGIAWLIRRLGRTGRPPLLGFLLVFVSYALISLARPNITPDQIWSIRRFLPVVMPGLLIGAAYLGSRLWRFGRRGQAAVAVLAVAALGLTLNTSRHLATVPEGFGQLDEIHTVCDNLPDDAAVLLAGGDLVSGYVMTVRSWCGVPTRAVFASPDQPLTPDVLSTIEASAAAAGKQLYVLTTNPKVLPPGQAPVPAELPVMSRLTTRFWKPSLVHPASDVLPITRTMYLARVAPDGTVTAPDGQRTLNAVG